MKLYYKKEEDLFDSVFSVLGMYHHNAEENRENAVKFSKEFHNFDLNEVYAISVGSFLVERIRDWKPVKSNIKFSLKKIREDLLLELERFRPIESIHKTNCVKVDTQYQKTISGLLGKSGLYYLYDKDKELIYIGKSVNLGVRMLESAKFDDVKYCKFSIVNNKSDMSILEVYLISKYKPKYNKDLKYDDTATIEMNEPDKCSEFISVSLADVDK